MSLKRSADNESGITYTLEAIIGVLLMIGTIIYLTSNMPYTAQKTGDHSKVQLMNIGRDNLDMTLITSAYEIHGGGVPLAKYRLTADNYSVKVGDSVNFTVYDVYSDAMINNSFNFNATVLFISAPSNITANVSVQGDNTGHHKWYPPNGIRSDDLKGKKNYEYSVLAYDSLTPVGYSNFVTIKVGDYNNTPYNTSILGDGIISGLVNYPYSNDTPVKDLMIQLLKASSGGPTLNNPNYNTGLTDLNGYFSFLWSDFDNGADAGTFFIHAYNQTSNEVSNMHVIETSGGGDHPKPALCASISGFSGFSSCDIIDVYEGDDVDLYLNDGSEFKPTGQNFYVNFIQDAKVNGDPPSCSGCYITTSTSKTLAKFKSALPGIYSVFICSNACQNNIWNSAQATNILLIYVHPIDPGKIADICVNGTELNKYMRRYIPMNINYNMYLIGPSGNKFTKCPDFPIDGVINGFPTAEAVAVNKLVHINYIPTKIDNIVEYRMVLWYK